MLTLGAILLAVLVVPAPWGWVLVVAAALVDVAETVVMVRWSKRRRQAVGREALIGRRVVATTRVAPTGRVRVAGELWAARSAGVPLEPGDEGVIRAVEELTLVIERVYPDAL
jgi:membrane protein implicated in regulation of membrane protease activity